MKFSNRQIKKVSSMSDNFSFDEALRHFLVPRVVGTDQHRRVREVYKKYEHKHKYLHTFFF